MIDRILKNRQNIFSSKLKFYPAVWSNSFALSVLLFTFLLTVTLLSSCSSEHQQEKVILSYPDADSEPALLYLSKCSECHAAPLTTAHTAHMWVSVIDRMQFRMISKKIYPLNDNDKASILQYLQIHAKKE